MKSASIVAYLANCLWLIIPALLWNVVFTRRLPKAFSPAIFEKDIPAVIAYPEAGLRLFVFIFPLFMPLTLATRQQQVGLAVYLVGTLVYFAAWGLLMVFPQSGWSTSWVGFVAPAYTPLIWLLGISLIGDAVYFPLPYRWWYYAVGAAAFLVFHISHTTLVYLRTL